MLDRSGFHVMGFISVITFITNNNLILIWLYLKIDGLGCYTYVAFIVVITLKVILSRDIVVLCELVFVIV